ncbi:phage tail assembly chaperone [Pseudomonas sp. TWP3-2]|uniref:phage tail assembly chaperone n=1 Tax=Pseudomonas sp. TWP3-2 TaxID=2804574 RepID=UPI003CEB0765
MIYYSQSPAGFYNTESHGERRILVIDPNWSRPLKDGDPDEEAEPQWIEVDNPACLIPANAVAISDELYESLLLAPSRSKVIVPGPDGLPMEADLPPMSDEEAAATERSWRDAQLAESDGVVSRHRDEVEAGGATTLTAEQYTELQAYRQKLRKWPQGEEFPLVDHRPVAPTWLVDGEVLL